jgi:hypothetical protein
MACLLASQAANAFPFACPGFKPEDRRYGSASSHTHCSPTVRSETGKLAEAARRGVHIGPRRQGLASLYHSQTKHIVTPPPGCGRPARRTHAGALWLLQAGLVEGYVELEFPAMQVTGSSTSNVTGFYIANVTAQYTVVTNQSALDPELPLLFFFPHWNAQVRAYMWPREAPSSPCIICPLSASTAAPLQDLPWNAGMRLPTCPAH